MKKPLAIDLCAGLGGWTEGLLAEGWRVRGYDIEAHEYGDDRYPAELLLRNVLEMHGSEIADADLIVASPPCQAYSYMAMPWSLAKAKAAAIRADASGEMLRDLNAIFDACFRIQREACEAAGRHIPMVVENVRGAQPWVGRAAWNYGSFYLWGDLPALMPSPRSREAVKAPGLGAGWVHPSDPRHTPGLDFTRIAGDHATKNPGFRFDGSGRSFQTASVNEATKGVGIGSISWGQGKGQRHPNDPRNFWSKSSARKAASAMIAKIPLALSSHIARVYKPKSEAA